MAAPPQGQECPEATQGRPVYLLWLTDDKGHNRTYWLRDCNGRAAVVAFTDKVVAVSGDKVWEWVDWKRPVLRPTVESLLSEHLEEGPDKGAPGAVHTWVADAFLAEVGSGARVPLASENLDPGESVAEALEAVEVSPVGLAGRFLLAKVFSNGYAGGAHGYWSTDFRVIDLSTGKVVKDPLPSNPAQSLPAEFKQAVQKLENDPEADPATDGRLVAFQVTYGQDGQLQTALQFAGDCCFAASDQLWASYTRSVMVPAAQPLPQFVPFQKLPQPLLPWCRFAAARNLRLGWTSTTGSKVVLNGLDAAFGTDLAN